MSGGGGAILFVSRDANFQKFNRPFMRMMRDQGWRVDYASNSDETVLDCDAHYRVGFARSPWAVARHVRAYQQIKRVMDLGGYDIIHVNTPVAGVVARLAARQARKKGARVIYTAHGFHFMKGGPLTGWLLWYPIEKLMARLTDTLITINDEDYQRARTHFTTDVRQMPGVGVDPARFFPDPPERESKADLRRMFGLRPDAYVVVYVAEITRSKNHRMLLEALALIAKETPNMQAVLAGADAMNGRTQALARKLGLAEKVIFLGYQRYIPDLLRASDLAVSVSRREGLPLNLLEAIAAGLPVLGTRVRGHTSFLRDDEMFDLGDTARLAARILAAANGRPPPPRPLPDRYTVSQACAALSQIYHRPHDK